MGLVDGDSVGRTLDRALDAIHRCPPISEADREDLVAFLTARASLPGAYGPGMVAPTAADLREGVRLYSGERISSGAGVRHVLGEETCRLLVLLGDGDRIVESTRQTIMAYLAQPQNLGRFCCGTCTVAVWRNMAAGGLADREAHLAAGMRHLREARDDEGGWGIYPFHYTVLALSELDSPAAREEKRHAARRLERLITDPRGSEPYATRRRRVAMRVLEAI